MKRITFLIILLLFLSGCASLQESFREIREEQEQETRLENFTNYLAIGMTTEETIELFGKPDDVNFYGRGTPQQWIYDRPWRPYNSLILYFENNKLVDFQWI